MNKIAIYNMIATIAVLLLFLLLATLFLITLQNTLKAVEPENRMMQPSQVWLLFIPVFNIYWVFKVVYAIAGSTKNQLEIYSIHKRGKPWLVVGIVWAVSVICNRLPVVGPFFAFASLILFITYWFKINDLRRELLSAKEIYRFRGEDSIL